MARRHMVAQGFSPGVEVYKYGNPDARRGGIMPMLQYVASLFRLRAHALRRDRVPPHHPVGFVLIFSPFPRVWGFESSLSSPTQVVRVAHSTPWLLYAASPCGEAPEFGLPCRQAGPPRSSRAPARRTFQFVGRAKRAECKSPEGERTKAGGGAAEPRNPCNAEKRYLSPGNLRRKKALQYSDSSLSVTPFHGAQNYFPSLAGAALTIVRLPLPEFFRPPGGGLLISARLSARKLPIYRALFKCECHG